MPYKCQQCESKFQSQSNLNRHIRIHKAEKPFSCTQCGQSFSQKANQERHLRTHTYKCHECKITFITMGELKIHRQEHCTCGQCGKICRDKGLLKRHLRTHEYKCHECVEKFTTELELTQHSQKHLTCEKCGMFFAQKKNLNRHKEENNCDKSFACEHCGHKFSQKKTLKKHLETHFIVCKYCGIKFKSSLELQKHFQVHLVCSECGEKFQNKNNYFRHLDTHTSDKNYSCSECGQAFQRNTPYKRHLQVHSEKQNHLCKECYTSFSRQDNLNRHMQSHTTDDAFHCQHCDKPFASHFLLAKHLNTHINLQKESENNDKSKSAKLISIFDNVSPQMVTFKGIGFENPSRKNLCYINATINALLNCKSFMNLINSERNCELIREIRHSLTFKQDRYSSENLRTFLINHNKDQFKDNIQSDPADLIQCFLDISESFKTLFLFQRKYTRQCKNSNCQEKTYSDDEPLCGLLENIEKERSISGIIQENRVSTVNSNCHKCARDTDKKQTEEFTSLPEILMVQINRFLPGNFNIKNIDNITPDKEIILNNTKYFLKSVIVHTGDFTNHGHYTALCIQENGIWIECDDSNIRESYLPMQGYIFLYEKSIAITYTKTKSSSKILKTYEDKTQQNKHMDVEKNYQCIQCKNIFATNFDLNNHAKTHISENDFKCNLCDQTFSDNSDLISHSNIHNINKHHKCFQCEKVFPNKSDMLTHATTHNAEELHKCRLCELSFSSDEGLKKHVKTHIGGKTFQCNTCDKAFRSNSVLKSHMKIHNLDKPYECSKCHKSFKTKQSIIKHQQKHTGEKNINA